MRLRDSNFRCTHLKQPWKTELKGREQEANDEISRGLYALRHAFLFLAGPKRVTAASRQTLGSFHAPQKGGLPDAHAAVAITTGDWKSTFTYSTEQT